MALARKAAQTLSLAGLVWWIWTGYEAYRIHLKLKARDMEISTYSEGKAAHLLPPERKLSIIDDDAFEASLQGLQTKMAAAGRPELGLLGIAPLANQETVRESIAFLGGGAAALLQLAHPGVAYAIDEHSYTTADVPRRFSNTFRYVFAVTFGNSTSTFRAARAVRKVHSRIKGTYPEDVGAAYPAGAQYDARDEASVKWVFATLIETAEFVNSVMLSPIPVHVVEQSYQFQREVACRVWGLHPSAYPETHAAFKEYYFQMIHSNHLVVSPAAKTMGDHCHHHR